MAETNNFRIQGKKLFLTYSQCAGNKKDLLGFLDDKLGGIDDYIVAEEKHKDGGTHFHVFLGLSKKCNVTNSRYFDWCGYHPNVSKCKDEYRVMRYCKKENDFITNMSFDTFQRVRDLAKEGNWKDALKLLIEEKPEEIRFLDKWEKNLKTVARMFAQKTLKTKYKIEDFVEVDLKWKPRKQTLVISGKSGYGKTQFAKTLFKNPLIVRHMDKLKSFDELEHDGIIFDDMNFSHWPRESCIHLVDIEEDTDLNVKCGMVTLPAGTPRVITTNRRSDEIFSSFDKAIRRRITTFEVMKDLRKLGEQQCYICSPSSEEESYTDFNELSE